MTCTTTSDVHPDERPACPIWCSEHWDIDKGHPTDHAMHHRGQKVETTGISVYLERYDLLKRGLPGAVSISVNDTLLTPQQATELAGQLAAAATEAADCVECDEAAVVVVVELGEGTDFVDLPDLNVVAVSNRLDKEGRDRALTRAGLR